MTSSSSFGFMVFTIFLITSPCLLPCQAQLSDESFYDSTCPRALSIIRGRISTAVASELRMAASLIRLHFHDCFVQGCDASILLNDTQGERSSISNANSVRGFEVIEAIKAELEEQCAQTVSCADIVAVAARDASVAVSGPTWPVKLGRLDSPTAAAVADADANLPRFDNTLPQLITFFSRKGFNERELVALSGAHTFGRAKCFFFRDRVNGNGNDIDAGFARTIVDTVPCPGDGSGNDNLGDLDFFTPETWDNRYFMNLIENRGLLASDQALHSGGSTDSIVEEYAINGARFRSDFAAAMIKMGDLPPPNGLQGQIRRVCSVPN
ncbi:lignin-forming anionic peroxidase [Ricinus communis]|uniref:Peroxidase n=1 Tax=Ricinus communis TaxID=3988 RepID=B9RC51_RICCO|nr:lignin-forming anionic peroxidase [Ricinus communis]EEF51122.1 Lignin-forming anionic peroxidase precursor, putative [Ricinus communis]|eukprot:XP_002509735.3 lignin-forming anionic peroxidase [Ricinus communis]